MGHYYKIVAGDVTFYSTDVACKGGFIHLYGSLKTRDDYKEYNDLITIGFYDVNCFSRIDRESLNAILNTFEYELDDNDNIVPDIKTETYISLKSLDDIVCKLRNAEFYLTSSLYAELYGISLSQYEKLRRDFGERKKSECEFTEYKDFLIFEDYNISVKCLNFEEREV
jgi:hypothetical protein